jgi:uncharacterized membrane protein
LNLATFIVGQGSDEQRCFHVLYHTTLSITFREFALTSNEVADKVLPQLKGFQFRVLRTSLSNQDEAKLREALDIPTA